MGDVTNGIESNTQSPTRNCSLCSKPFYPEDSNTLPFCSVRCQQIDLGKWLGESYGFPIESGEVSFEDDPENE